MREARKNGCIPEEDIQTHNDDQIRNLEIKTATLENQIGILFKKLEKVDHTLLSLDGRHCTRGR